MNHYNTERHGAMIDATPLFASVWMALFWELRKNYHAWRLETAANADTHDKKESK